MEKTNEILKKFLSESNHIENERGQNAHDDAYKAWRFLENFNELTVDRILETHKILMERLNKKIAGRLRNVDVRVGREVMPPHERVGELLDLWAKQLGDVKTEEEIKVAHVAFEGIHPFQDGNGRIGRILYNWQRVKNGFPIEVFLEKDKFDYYRWFGENF